MATKEDSQLTVMASVPDQHEVPGQGDCTSPSSMHTEPEAKAAEHSLDSSHPRKATQDLIMSLPIELRLELYKLALPPAVRFLRHCRGIVRLQDNNHEKVVAPPLLFTSITIRAEVLGLLYNRLTLSLPLRDGRRIEGLTRKMHADFKLGGPQQLGRIRIVVPSRNSRETLKNLLPLVELMRTFAFDPVQTLEKAANESGGSEDPGSSIVRFEGKKQKTAAEAWRREFETVLRLGRLARAEGWEAEKLAKWFRLLVNRGPVERSRAFVVEGRVL